MKNFTQKYKEKYEEIKQKAGTTMRGIFSKKAKEINREKKPAESNFIHKIAARNSAPASDKLADIRSSDQAEGKPMTASQHISHSQMASTGMAEKSEKTDKAENKHDKKTAHSITHSISSAAPTAPKPDRIYLDYASLTPIDPRVKKVMIDAMDEHPANPSSLYKEGVKAKKALHDARTSIAQFFSVQPDEIIFTSGGTESNSLAFQGVLNALSVDDTPRPHFIISTIEHPSIVEIALDLTSRGYDVSFVPVNKDGIVDPKDIKKALRPETVLVSVMFANNEIGTIQPIKDIAREVRHYKKSLGRATGEYPYMHTDACQAVLFEDMRIPSLGVDLLSIDGGKIYGPRGMGVLMKRRHVDLEPVFLGGSQEFGLRAGTENLPSIIGLKHALDIAHSERDEMVIKMGRFQETMHDLLFARLATFMPGMSLNGHPTNRLPNNLNICFPKMDAEFLVLRLDALGVALSSVTSCRASNEDSSSYVIEALGKKSNTEGDTTTDDCAQSSLRITFGRYTTGEEVAIAIEKIVQAVKEQMEA